MTLTDARVQELIDYLDGYSGHVSENMSGDVVCYLKSLLALRQRLAEAERLVKRVQPVGLPGPIVGVRIGPPGRRDAVEKRAHERQFFVDRDKFLKGSHE